jgi:hypothetical protein
MRLAGASGISVAIKLRGNPIGGARRRRNGAACGSRSRVGSRTVRLMPTTYIVAEAGQRRKYHGSHALRTP